MLKRRFFALTIASLLSTSSMLCASPRAYACGDETGASCDTDRDDARYMLRAAVAAVEKDETSALGWFTEQSHGFRTEDLYVYCIGPDHMVNAHPDPKIDHTDATRSLIDTSGFHFGDEMMGKAKEGAVADITYRWPRLNGYKPSVKHTMYTKVKDQFLRGGLLRIRSTGGSTL